MLDFEECWAALERRDAGAAGRFFYGVRTTGVYCRPGCTSRLPLRANTMFFETTAAAEAAGLRPCKRCRPTDGSSASRHVAAIERACALLRTSETMPSLAELADAAGISRFHFHRVFKQITGATPRDYARTHRLGRLAEKLEAGQPVTEAIYASGFGSSSRAYEAAPAALGMTPGARRRGGSGRDDPLCDGRDAARLGIGRRDRARHLHDRARRRSRQPRRRVAAALPGRRDRRRGRRAQGLGRPDRAASSPLPTGNLDLPLDIQGTAFQARVWRALQKIPLGKTATYTEIAAALGQPKAVRAVAQACAANKLALLVPCHRVIRSDGDLGGYRWGVERKRALLARERAAAAREPADEAAA